MCAALMSFEWCTLRSSDTPEYLSKLIKFPSRLMLNSLKLWFVVFRKQYYFRPILLELGLCWEAFVRVALSGSKSTFYSSELCTFKSRSLLLFLSEIGLPLKSPVLPNFGVKTGETILRVILLF